MTIYIDLETEKILKKHVKSSRDSVSKWIAEAIKRRASSEWPADVLAVLGSWKKDDFPDPVDLRQGYGVDLPRESF